MRKQKEIILIFVLTKACLCVIIITAPEKERVLMHPDAAHLRTDTCIATVFCYERLNISGCGKFGANAERRRWRMKRSERRAATVFLRRTV